MHYNKENLVKNNENVTDFDTFKNNRLLTAGGEPPTENWLANLEAGTCFLARERGVNPKDEMLAEYHVVHKAAISIGLVLVSPMGQKALLRVDSLRFSRKFELVEVLGREIPEEEQEKETKEIDNGDSNQL